MSECLVVVERATKALTSVEIGFLLSLAAFAFVFCSFLSAAVALIHSREARSAQLGEREKKEKERQELSFFDQRKRTDAATTRRCWFDDELSAQRHRSQLLLLLPGGSEVDVDNVEGDCAGAFGLSIAEKKKRDASSISS